MVHALSEARRVLRPGGILVDLRPAAKHRRVGLGEGRRWRLVGVMRERFDEDHAADRAVARAIREGWFRPEARRGFLLERAMDTIADFRTWLGEFRLARTAASHQWLVRRLERAGAGESARIVARGPMNLQVLRAR